MCILRVFGLVLIIVDICLVVADLAIPIDSRAGLGDWLEAISLAIAIFFLVDVLLRVYGEG